MIPLGYQDRFQSVSVASQVWILWTTLIVLKRKQNHVNLFVLSRHRQDLPIIKTTKTKMDWNRHALWSLITAPGLGQTVRKKFSDDTLEWHFHDLFMNDEWVKTSFKITAFHSYFFVKFASIAHCNDIWCEYAFNAAFKNETQTNVKSSPTSIKIQIIQNRDIFFKPTEWTNYQLKINDAKSFQPLLHGH